MRSRQPLFVPNFEGCIPVEKVEDLVGCDVTVEGGMRDVPYGMPVPFDGGVHVAGIQYRDGRELFLQLPDRTFMRLTSASRITRWVRSQKVVESAVAFCDPQHLSHNERELYREARAVADSIPVSAQRREGAAVLLEDCSLCMGRTKSGGAGEEMVCAEDDVLSYVRECRSWSAIRAIALSGPSDALDGPDPLAPCGACRQKILACQEAARGPIVVLFSGGYGQVARVESIEALLPFARNKE